MGEKLRRCSSGWDKSERNSAKGKQGEIKSQESQRSKDETHCLSRLDRWRLTFVMQWGCGHENPQEGRRMRLLRIHIRATMAGYLASRPLISSLLFFSFNRFRLGLPLSNQSFNVSWLVSCKEVRLWPAKALGEPSGYFVYFVSASSLFFFSP